MKCPECGEHMSDIVTKILAISILIAFFCFGWMVRNVFLIIDIFRDYYLTTRIMIIVEIGSVAFFLLACLVLWLDD